jgi:3-isopropylmalate dehydrogenase
VRRKIAVIGGDGIGPEVVAGAQAVLETVAPGALRFTAFDWGAERFLRDGVTLPADGLATMRQFDAILFGAVGDPRVPSNRHAAEILLGLRFGLDLYANVRPVRPLLERLCPLKEGAGKVDFVVVRENTEGPYVSMGGRFKPGSGDEVATETDINTYRGVERVQRYAFELARGRRRRLHLVDKANALIHAGALWRRVFAELQSRFPDVTAAAMYVDAAAMQMVREPEQFDVIATNNLFGDILTDLAAALQGGLGMAASGNLHPEQRGGAPGGPGLFEPVHGSAPALAGKDLANPMGAILSGAMMLDQLGMMAEAKRVEQAVTAALAAGECTADVGGTMGTRAVTEAVVRRL